jgi:aryl-alcohol dehydrogenase-like predicted oxidoreductase
MKTKPLSHTGIEVSSLCLGTMYFGTRTDKEMSFRLLDQYVTAGGSFLDTANIYSWWVPGFKGHESEILLGEWLRARRNRAHVFIATKVGFGYGHVESGLRARLIETECEGSLKRMGVDTIDLFYAHVDDRNTPQEETLTAFDRLVKAGKVRLIGASNFLAWRLEEARWVSQTRGLAEYCCIQQRYSYVRPKPGAGFDPQIAANDDLLGYCRTRGLTLLAYCPLLNGAYNRADRPLAAQYLGPDTDVRLAALRKVAGETGVTPIQVVLAWMVQSGVIPLVAASTPEQMRENLDALKVSLSPEQMACLDQASA